MKRILAGLVLLLFAVLNIGATGGLLQFGAVPWQTYYYVNAASGSDSNNGTTPATAWQTLHQVNNSVFAANSVVSLQGSFSGGDNGLIITTTVAPSGALTITSYGPAQATINSGNSTACVTATNVPLFKFIGIACAGGGNTTNTTAGISIVNSQAGNTKLAGPTISGVTVSGYGMNCIEVVGSNGSSGFNGWSIGGGTIAHDCTGNYSTAVGSSCIDVFSNPDYGSGYVTPAHTNFTIIATVYNCTGTSGSPNWSGSGITVFESRHYTISNSVAHDYGINSISPGGIWTADSGDCFFLDSEVYNGNGRTQNSYDFDGGTVNCVGRNLKAHNNTGSDFAMINYNDGTCCALWGNNTFEFVEGQNAAISEFLVNFDAAATGPLNVIRSTFVNSLPTGSLITQGPGSSAFSGTVANNILIETGGTNGYLISLPSPSSLNFYGNDYYTYNQQINFGWSNVYYGSLAAWQTATGQEKIGGVGVGLTSNPQIYVPGGLFTSGGYVPADDMADNLQSGSPMIGGGVGLAQFGITLPTTDYYGATVAAGSQTIGAAEGDFATFVASCTQTSTYLSGVSGFNKLDNVNYNSWICGTETDGDLSKMDVAYLLAAPNHAAMLLDVSSNGHNLTEHGTVTFTARTGIASDGTTGYEDTGWNVNNGPNYIQNSVTDAGYDLTGCGAAICGSLVQNFNVIWGVQNTAGTSETTLIPNNTNGASPGYYADANDETGISGAVPANPSKGFWVGQRTTSSALAAWFNGTEIKNVTVNSVALPNANMFLLAQSNATGSGLTGNWMPDTISLAFVGGGGISSLNTSLRANSFMQAYGINVY